MRSSSRGGELDRRSSARDLTVIRARRAQPHLDPLVLAVEEGDVLEGLDVEVGAELAVEDAQDVAVELAVTPAVVVGGLRIRGSLTRSVPSRRWSIAGSQQPRERAQEAGARPA